MSETYTRAQIMRGEGFFTRERTMIYLRPDGRYVTAARSDTPGTDLVFVASGYLRDGKPQIIRA
jgi:hypothetical protein